MSLKVNPNVPYAHQLAVLNRKRGLRVHQTADPNILSTYNPWADYAPCKALAPNTQFKVGDRVVIVHTGYFVQFPHPGTVLKQVFPIYHVVCKNTGRFEMGRIGQPAGYNPRTWPAPNIIKL